ncbi:hypothetical protein J0H58_32190, partial [bacterium]|nr:hypothetical protein [bacterium]
MQPLPPDPTGRPTPPHGAGSSVRRPSAERSLSDILRESNSGRRKSPADDVAAHLSAPPGSPAPDPDPDDAPTVITRGGGDKPLPPPPPPYIVGDVAAVGGRRLGHFELIEAVGAGGMAAVLKA